jgi:hypothetical protein
VTLQITGLLHDFSSALADRLAHLADLWVKGRRRTGSRYSRPRPLIYAEYHELKPAISAASAYRSGAHSGVVGTHELVRWRDVAMTRLLGRLTKPITAT